MEPRRLRHSTGPIRLRRFGAPLRVHGIWSPTCATSTPRPSFPRPGCTRRTGRPSMPRCSASRASPQGSRVSAGTLRTATSSTSTFRRRVCRCAQRPAAARPRGLDGRRLHPRVAAPRRSAGLGPPTRSTSAAARGSRTATRARTARATPTTRSSCSAAHAAGAPLRHGLLARRQRAAQAARRAP